MKTYLIIFILGMLTSCTHYTTTPMNQERVIVSKTTNVLGLFGGTIYTCKKDEKGVVTACNENRIRSVEEKYQEDYNPTNEERTE